MECEIKVKDHATDKCIDLGITNKELNEGINKGARRKRIKLGKNKSKDFITYRYYEMVCIKQPCHLSIETVY